MNYEWYESTKKTLQNTCHIVSQLFSHPQLPTHLWMLLKQGKGPAQSSGLVGMPHHRLCNCVTITHTCVSTCLGVGTSVMRDLDLTLSSPWTILQQQVNHSGLPYTNCPTRETLVEFEAVVLGKDEKANLNLPSARNRHGAWQEGCSIVIIRF